MIRHKFIRFVEQYLIVLTGRCLSTHFFIKLRKNTCHRTNKIYSNVNSITTLLEKIEQSTISEFKIVFCYSKTQPF